MEYRILNRKDALAGVREDYRIDDCYQAMGQECLKNNIKVRNVTLPEIQVIEQQAFCGCTALRTVEFPKIRKVKEEAFANCSNLKEIQFSENLCAIGGQAFYKCKRIENVDFQENSQCKTIASGTFAECRQMKHVTLPKELEVIEE